MIKRYIFVLCILAFSSFTEYSQVDQYNWSNWNFLIGKWQGIGSGNPGEGTGYFSFNLELNGNILYRKNHSEYPGHENQPARLHDDIMIIFCEDSKIANKAIFFDAEGHVIRYNIDYPKDIKKIILTSEPSSGFARYRLSYTMVDNITVEILFEVSSSENPDSFTTYLQGLAMKKE